MVAADEGADSRMTDEERRLRQMAALDAAVVAAAEKRKGERCFMCGRGYYEPYRDECSFSALTLRPVGEHLIREKAR